MNEKIFYGMIAVGFVVVGIIIGNASQKVSDDAVIDPIEQIDYSDRFDRIETGIVNSAIDACFASGGKWLNDGNQLLWIDLIEGVEVSLCARPKTT